MHCIRLDNLSFRALALTHNPSVRNLKDGERDKFDRHYLFKNVFPPKNYRNKLTHYVESKILITKWKDPRAEKKKKEKEIREIKEQSERGRLLLSSVKGKIIEWVIVVKEIPIT